MEKIRLGRSGIMISRMGMGCWAIGGPWSSPEGKPLGWGEVDDNESIRAVHAGLAAGINFIDTANVYGAGHSEQVLGKALEGRRSKVVLATKFGGNIDEATKTSLEPSAAPESIRRSCEDSLRRLKTDYIDLFQFHLGGYDPAEAPAVMAVLEELVAAGKIRWYGWSTDSVEGARVFARGEHCAAVQFQMNVVSRNDAMTSAVEELGLTGILRGPLAMGLLSGKYGSDTHVSTSDIRGAGMEWMRFFKPDGTPNPDFLAKIAQVREHLTADGRSLVQGALGWFWARSASLVPIPGFRTVAQIEENAGALERGALPTDAFEAIERILA